MSKIKKIIAVILCLSFLVPLLPQQEVKEVEAAESTEIIDENPNLLTIGGFDTADCLKECSGSATRVEWEESDDVWNSSDSGCLKLPYNAENNSNSFIYYSVAVEPNTKYTISLYTKFDNGGMLQLVAYDENGASSDKGLVHQNNSAGYTMWTQVEYTFETKAEQKALKIRLGNMSVATGVTGIATCYVDDLQIRMHEHSSTSDSRTCSTKYMTIGEKSEKSCSDSVLIANGSMQGKDTPYQWKWNHNGATSWGLSETDANGRPDSYSLCITNPVSQQTNVYTVTGTLKGNDTHYRLTWKVKGDTDVKVYPRLTGVTNNSCKTDHKLLDLGCVAVCNEESWTQGEMLITNMVEQTYTLYFYFKGDNIKEVLLDDVKLVEIEDHHVDANCDGKCDFTTDWILNTNGTSSGAYQCDKTVVGFSGAQAVLSDEIRLKLYIRVDADDEKALAAKVNGKDVEIQTDTRNSGLYISIPFAAKEMTDTVTAELYLNDEKTAEKTYSVREYAEAILKEDSLSASWDMVKAMLNYGAWAQTYFDYKTTELANSVVTKYEKYDHSNDRATFQSYITGYSEVVQSGVDNIKVADDQVKYEKESACVAQIGETVTITAQDENNYNIWLANEMTTELAGNYKMSFWVKTNNQSAKTDFSVYPCVRWQGEKGNWIEAKDMLVKETTDWQKVVYSFTIPSTCTVNFHTAIHVNLGDGGSVSVAGCKLEKIDGDTGVAGYKPTIENQLNSFLGYSLVLKDKTSVRLYFNSNPDSVTVDDNAVQVQQKGGKYYVEIADVKAGNLGKTYMIVVKSGDDTMTISNFSVLSAAATAINGGSANEKLKDLCVALILYAEAAKVVQ